MTPHPDRRAALKAAALTAFAGLVGCDQAEVPPGLITPPKPDAPPAPPMPAGTPRAKAIREAAESIRAECQRNAGGDWAKWQQQTAAYRDAVKARTAAAVPFNPIADSPFLEARSKVLAPIDDFPLFECASDQYLTYLTEPDRVDRAELVRKVTAADRWLKRRGIDLIFVLAPKMLEVYPDHYAAPCPADRVVNPHVRRLALDLLEADVEVLDVLPLLLAARDASPDPLYLPADPHWAPKGYEVAVRATVDRLNRYPFVAASRSAPPAVRATTQPFPEFAAAKPCASVAVPALDPEQRKRAETAHPKTFTRVLNPNGGWPWGDDKAPVMIIGNSYTGGYDEAVCRDINMVIQWRASGGQTTEAFADLLREPEVLESCKVVVWVTNSAHLTAFKPMPGPVLAAAESPR